MEQSGHLPQLWVVSRLTSLLWLLHCVFAD